MKLSPQRMVIAGAVVYTIVFSAFSLWKYWNLGYNALDLAIYSQTLFNSSHGQWFALTIHPHSYLGDHIELILLLLVPFVRLIPRPETLLVLQAAILASGAFPLLRIAQRKLPALPAIGIAALYLLNPIVQNITLFEFHALPFAIPLLLWAWDAYERRHFPQFLLFLTLSLLVREDVAISAVAFSAIALIHRREKRWVLAPFVMSVVWFIASTHLAGALNGYGSYKFLYYYAWLGETPGAMLQTFLTRPLFILKHLATLQHLVFIGGLLLPLLFLPLLRPLPLLGALLPWAQTDLIAGGASLLEIQTHYAALIIPWLFIASVESFSAIYRGGERAGVRERLRAWIAKEPGILWTLIGTVTLYSMMTIGPLITFVSPGLAQSFDERETRTVKQFLALIPDDASVASSLQTLAPLAMREHIYSMHYAFLGKKQFSDEDYKLPEDAEYLLIDGQDFLMYTPLYPPTHSKYKQVATGDDRLRELVNERGFHLRASAGDWTLWKRDPEQPFEIVQRLNNIPSPLIDGGGTREDITLLGASPLTDTLTHPYDPHDFTLVPLSLFWKSVSDHAENRHLRFRLRNPQGVTVWEHLSPLGYGFLPTTEWRAGDMIETRHWLLLPKTQALKTNRLEIELVRYTGGTVTLNGLRSAVQRDVIVETANNLPLLTIPLSSLLPDTMSRQ